MKHKRNTNSSTPDKARDDQSQAKLHGRLPDHRYPNSATRKSFLLYIINLVQTCETVATLKIKCT